MRLSPHFGTSHAFFIFFFFLFCVSAVFLDSIKNQLMIVSSGCCFFSFLKIYFCSLLSLFDSNWLSKLGWFLVLEARQHFFHYSFIFLSVGRSIASIFNQFSSILLYFDQFSVSFEILILIYFLFGSIFVKLEKFDVGIDAWLMLMVVFWCCSDNRAIRFVSCFGLIDLILIIFFWRFYH